MSGKCNRCTGCTCGRAADGSVVDLISEPIFRREEKAADDRNKIIAAINDTCAAIGNNIPDAELAGKIGRAILMIYEWPGNIEELPPETKIELDFIRSWPGTGSI